MSPRTIAVIASVALGAALLASVPVVAGAAPTAQAPPVATREVPDPGTRLTLFAGLPRDSKGLAAAGRRASTPGSGDYRDFLTLKKLASTYGASPAAIKKLRATARDLGISVAIDATGLFARLTAPVSTWERVMGAEVTYEPAQEGSAGADPPGPQPFARYSFLNADGSLLLAAPASLRGVVSEFVPQYTVYDVTKDIPGVPPMTRSAAAARSIFADDTLPWPVNEGTPLGPVCDAQEIANGQVITPSQTRSVYGAAALQKRGYSGSKARVTIVSLGGGFSTGDLDEFADCFDLRAPQVDVTLGTGNPTRIVSFSGETHLDLQTVTGVLVDAPRIQLVQAINDSLNVGIIDGFSRALSSPRGVPDAVSLSYGGCELGSVGRVQVGQVGQMTPLWTLLNDVLAGGAVVGSAFFTGSGDTGSSICQQQLDGQIVAPTVALPASSIWITAAGGTRLELGKDNRRITEVVWNDHYFGVPAAGGGGVSALVKAPWYQRGRTGQQGRTTPDSSTLAAIIPGWPVVYGDNLLPIGGTSGSSPFHASNVALISGHERTKGRPAVGFVNPWFYSAASRNFYDVTEGDNQIEIIGQDFINVPACCWAYPGYDLASGLGAPYFDRLASALPKPE